MSLLDTASLIVTPNGYKEGKLYSVIPSDGSGDMSVTRATTATRVNSAGLVELVPYNLVQYSEQFDNAYWSKFQCTITANDTIAPNGTTTAEKVIATDNGAAVVYVSDTAYINGVYNWSVYAKAGNQNKVYLEAYGVGGTICSTNINLATQTILTQTNFTNVNIESVGNGWYRISGCLSNLGGSIVTIGFGMATSVSTNDFVYFWGAQLVEGSTAKDYQKTETRLNIPRLDYSNGTCPSLLVEPQRTNLLTYSSSFDNSAYNKTNVSVTANTSTSPDGTQNADTITSNASSPQLLSPVVSFGTSTSVSLFVKYVSQKYVQLFGGGAFGDFANFDLENAIVGTIGSSTTNAKIENVGNGWLRISAVFSGYSGNTTARLGFTSALNSGWNSLDTAFNKSVLAYGFQIELGSYPTSYIPTTSASVTRNADVISKTGISSLIGQTEGTLFVDLYRENVNEIFFIILSDIAGTLANSYVNSFYLFQLSNGLFAADGFVSNVQQFKVEKLDGLSVGRHKIAMAYKQNDFALYIDGVLIGTDTSGNIPALNCLTIGGSGDVPSAKNIINATALWKTRLTNTQLAQLTTI